MKSTPTLVNPSGKRYASNLCFIVLCNNAYYKVPNSAEHAHSSQGKYVALSDIFAHILVKEKPTVTDYRYHIKISLYYTKMI